MLTKLLKALGAFLLDLLVFSWLRILAMAVIGIGLPLAALTIPIFPLAQILRGKVNDDWKSGFNKQYPESNWFMHYWGHGWVNGIVHTAALTVMLAVMAFIPIGTPFWAAYQTFQGGWRGFLSMQKECVRETGFWAMGDDYRRKVLPIWLRKFFGSDEFATDPEDRTFWKGAKQIAPPSQKHPNAPLYSRPRAQSLPSASENSTAPASGPFFQTAQGNKSTDESRTNLQNTRASH